MKTLKNMFIFVIVWMATATIILLTATLILPKGPDGKVTVGSTYTIIVLTVPIVCGVISVKKSSAMSEAIKAKKKQALKDSIGSEVFNIPKSAKKQNEMSKELLRSAESNLSIAYESSSVSLFVHFYEKAIQAFERASQLNKVNYSSSPKWKVQRLQDEFQLHLCDAIVKAKLAVIQDIKGKYVNSREFQEKAFSDFTDELDSLRTKFSPGTSEVADEALASIQAILNANVAKTKPVSSVDDMDGKGFEAWCAELLRRLDYKNIELTPETGDQGVDITAEKNDVKYAFQCKCYATDLGNKPVQEVSAGKAFYHCHVGIVITNRYFTQGGKDAAEATGTLLWDRDKVFGMAKETGML